MRVFIDPSTPPDERALLTQSAPILLSFIFVATPKALSKHIAHLFSRDPLVIFEGRIEEVDDEQEVGHGGVGLCLYAVGVVAGRWLSLEVPRRGPPQALREVPHVLHYGNQTPFRVMMYRGDTENRDTLSARD